jgi:hypothetical protein
VRVAYAIRFSVVNDARSGNPGKRHSGLAVLRPMEEKMKLGHFGIGGDRLYVNYPNYGIYAQFRDTLKSR